MTRQNIVDVLLVSSTVGIVILVEIKLDDGVLVALFSVRGWKAYMDSSTEPKRIMRSPVVSVRDSTGNGE